MTTDIPDLGYHALACQCGRRPVLSSGRCWTCEPKPAIEAPPDVVAKPATWQAKVLARLAKHPGSTAPQVANAIGHRHHNVTVILNKMRTDGRVRSEEGAYTKAGRQPHRWYALEKK